MRRRCRHQPSAETDPYAADLVRRLRRLMAIVAQPAQRCQDPVQRDDEELDRL